MVTTGKVVAIAKKQPKRVSSAERVAGTSEIPRSWAPADVAASIAALGSAPFGADVTIEAGGDLSAALGSYDVVYVSGDISITSTISSLDGKHIIFKDGVTVTFTSDLTNTDGFTVDSSARFSYATPGLVTFHAEHSGDFIGGDNSGHLTTSGTTKFTSDNSTANEPFTGVRGRVDRAIYELPGASISLGGTSSVDLFVNHLEFVGADTSSQINLTFISVGHLVLSGTFRAYSGVMGASYALLLSDASVGEVFFNAAVNWGLLISDDSSVALARASNSGANNPYLACTNTGSLTSFGAGEWKIVPTGSTQQSVIGFGETDNFEPASGATSHQFFGLSIGAAETISNLQRSNFFGGYHSAGLTFDSTTDGLQFFGTEFSSANTFQANSTAHVFTGCNFRGNETLPSGCLNKYVNCTFAGDLTIDSGANASLESCEITGTLTNNDAATRIRNCTDAGTAIADAPAASGGGEYTNFVTVAPSGADYTTLAGAVNAGETMIRVVDSVSETVVSVPANVDMTIELMPEVTITFANDINFKLVTYTSKLTLISHNATITNGVNTGQNFEIFDIAGSGSEFVMRGDLTFLNNSTSSLCPLVSQQTKQSYYGVVDITALLTRNGIYSTAGLYADHIIIRGAGGASTQTLLYVTGSENCVIGLVEVKGSWQANQRAVYIARSTDDGCRIGHIHFDTATSVGLNVEGVVGRIDYNSGSSTPYTCTLGSTNRPCYLMSGYLRGVTIQILSQSTIKNCELDFDLFSTISATAVTIDSCEGDGPLDDLSFGSLRGRVINCKEMGDITLTSGADDALVHGNFVGTGGTGTGTTVTIDSGCANAIVTSNHVDSAVVDNGTNTTAANNNVS